MTGDDPTSIPDAAGEPAPHEAGPVAAAPPFEPIATVDVTVEHLAPRGDGVATWEDRPLFVSRVLPGERVRVHVRKRYRNNAVGELAQVLEPSPHRTTPRCPLYGRCSGCQLQHVDMPGQLALKHEAVARALAEAGLEAVEVRPTLAAADPWHYRNHGRFTVVEGRIGFMRQRPKVHLPIASCPIMDPAINEAVAHAQGRVPEATQFNVRVGSRTGSRMIQPAFGDALDLPSGQPHLWEELGGRRFRISAPAFFQVHTAQAEVLVEQVRQILAPRPGEVVVDAYAGVGVFAALLAPSVLPGGKVVAIETSGPAMEDAEVNLADQPGVELWCGRTEVLLREVPGRLGAGVAGVVLDPPRTGCKPGALRAVEALGPRAVAYVSCDPPSLARDLARLQRDFEVTFVQPVDMFPHTRHIEAVAALRRRA